ncbi:MAG: molybdopterin-dependent oxidoreductase [Adlercreutzia sp.]|nr:molybdopterin-dependent oxidoreductase [Adlercreutzia sp.]
MRAIKKPSGLRSKRLALLCAIVAVMALCVVVAGCAPSQHDAADAVTEEEALAQTGDAEEINPAVMMHGYTDNSAGPFTDTWYNTNVLNAGARGCDSCHASLYETIKDIKIGDKPHIIGPPANGKDYSYRDCSPACHMGMSSSGQGPKLTDTIHSIHFSSSTFVDGGGICESCHAYDSTGQLVLWDDYKYQADLGGYADSSSDAIQTWNDARGIQNASLVDVVSLAEPKLEGVELSQPLSDDDDIFVAANYGPWEVDMASYKLTLQGVNGKADWTLDELKALPATEMTVTQDCAGNRMNGPLISNFNVKGVKFADLIEAAGGIAGSANAFTVVGDDTWNCFGTPFDVEACLANDVILAYEYNGHDLTPNQGYPLTLVLPGFGGNMWCKYVANMTFMESPITTADSWAYGANCGSMNAGWLTPAKDGAEYKVGEAVELSGWVYEHSSGGHAADAIAISADYGKTWTTIDIADDYDPNQWIWFKGTWTPEKAGTYILKVKAIDNQGAEQIDPLVGEPLADPTASVILKVTE